jgi:hypothetical protein
MVALAFHRFTDTIGGAAVGAATVLLNALVLDQLIPAADTGTSGTSQAGEAGPIHAEMASYAPRQRP